MLVWFDHVLPGLQKPPWLLPMKCHPVAKEYPVVSVQMGDPHQVTMVGETILIHVHGLTTWMIWGSPMIAERWVGRWAIGIPMH